MKPSFTLMAQLCMHEVMDEFVYLEQQVTQGHGQPKRLTGLTAVRAERTVRQKGGV